jgi:hypothetical protein
MSRRKWGWQQQWDAQGGLCWICLQPMLQNVGPHPLAASADHIVPRSRGGGERWRNKLLAHQDCNGKRGAPFVWVKLSVLRRAAMARIKQALVAQRSVEGVDLGKQLPRP